MVSILQYCNTQLEDCREYTCTRTSIAILQYTYAVVFFRFVAFNNSCSSTCTCTRCFQQSASSAFISMSSLPRPTSSLPRHSSVSKSAPRQPEKRPREPAPEKSNKGAKAAAGAAAAAAAHDAALQLKSLKEAKKEQETAAATAANAQAAQAEAVAKAKQATETAARTAGEAAKAAARTAAATAATSKAMAAAKTAADKAKAANNKSPPTAFMLWMNTEGRASAKAAYPGLQMVAIASVCGIMWNTMPSEEKLAWHVESNKLRAAHDAQQTALLGRGRKVKWASTAGNACQIFSVTNNEWLIGFIHERTGDMVHVVYETEGDTREKTLPIDSQHLKEWAPTINGACRVFSVSAKQWLDAVIVSQRGATLTVNYEIDGIGYSKQVDAGDTDVLRWPLYSEGEPMLNVGRFRALFKQGVLSIEDARKFCKNFFFREAGEQPAHTWQGACARAHGSVPVLVVLPSCCAWPCCCGNKTRSLTCGWAGGLVNR